MSTIKRTSRESEKKVLKEAKKPWTPPSSLDAPPAPNGYAHRWIRTNVQGFEDTANVSKKLREGWEFVKSDQIIEEIGQHNYPFYTEGRYKGCIGIGGLVLARIPEETLISRAEYFDKITQDRMNAVDNDLMKEQHPDMPINIDRQSRVTFGGSRKK
tara:strand:+ start:255 stop:725 length:471 start_codon:yes stop_codon:yes gene_type:complete